MVIRYPLNLCAVYGRVRRANIYHGDACYCFLGDCAPRFVELVLQDGH